jgi:hypothetical protein
MVFVGIFHVPPTQRELKNNLRSSFLGGGPTAGSKKTTFWPTAYGWVLLSQLTFLGWLKMPRGLQKIMYSKQRRPARFLLERSASGVTYKL